jgi:carboxymethylenebutenolidase
LKADQLNDQLAALEWLKKEAFIQPSRIAVAGNSFGGIETILGAEKGTYCAAIDASGAAETWAKSEETQKAMTESARNAKAPIFFFQARNDYDLAPSQVLSAAMQEAGKSAQVKIYPPYGNSQKDGHSFAYLGSKLWSNDVFAFLNLRCKK